MRLAEIAEGAGCVHFSFPALLFAWLRKFVQHT